MATSKYDKGDLVRSAVAFTNEAGAAADPTTITFKFKVGKNGTITTYVYGVNAELVKDSVGNYHVDLAIDTDSITYYVAFYGTGALIAADRNTFTINNDYFS